MSDHTDRPNRKRSATTLLVVVIVVLLGQVAWQTSRIENLKSRLAQSEQRFGDEVGKAAVERLRGRRADVIQTAQWLHEFYASEDGLGRPGGLWLDNRKQPDFEAIGAWVLDVYLQARVKGASDEEARQLIVTAIHDTDEWRRRHPAR